MQRSAVPTHPSSRACGYDVKATTPSSSAIPRGPPGHSTASDRPGRANWRTAPSRLPPHRPLRAGMSLSSSSTTRFPTVRIKALYKCSDMRMRELLLMMTMLYGFTTTKALTIITAVTTAATIASIATTNRPSSNNNNNYTGSSNNKTNISIYN